MSFTLAAKVMNLKIGSMAKKMVLLKLADQANDDGICWPSYQTIADACEVSRRTVIRHIKSLEQEGYLEIHKSYDKANKKNYSNKYRLTLEGGDKKSLVTNKALSGDTKSPPSDNVSSSGDTVSPKPIIKPINETTNEAGEKNGSKISIEDAINHLKISAILPTFGEVNKSELTAELYKFNQYYIDKGMPEKANAKNLISWFQLIKTEDRSKFTALDKKQAPANAPKIDVSKRFAHLKG